MFRLLRRHGMHRRSGLSVWIFATLLGCCSCSAKPPRPLGILIVTLDTTRADYLSAYGSGRVWTPHLDRLATGGIVFEQATTVAPLTLPAHCSLFTGLLPPRHEVRDNAGAALAPEHQTLAEILQRRGFETAAFVGSAVLAVGRGLEAGFDVYHDGITKGRRTPGSGLQRPADRIVDEAIGWLEGRDDTPFFLWVHLYDPHAPYDPPEPFRTAYADDRYAGEIAFADAQIGRLLDVLDRRRLLDRTAVVVAGDHGESLNEHGENGHGIFIYQNVIRVPLIVRLAGVPPRRVPEVTRLVDVMPTVLELVAAPPATTDGVSLVAAMTGSRLPDLEAYSESLYPERFGWSPLRSLRDGRFKLIEAPRPELYDLQTDPAEQHNLYTERAATAVMMSRRLNALTHQLATRHEASDPVGPAPETIERLAALGYVGAARTPPHEAGQPLPDPKDHIGEYNRLVRRRHETGRPR